MTVGNEAGEEGFAHCMPVNGLIKANAPRVMGSMDRITGGMRNGGHLHQLCRHGPLNQSGAASEGGCCGPHLILGSPQSLL